MEYLLNEPWLLGLVVGLVLAGAIELGRLTANYFRIQEDANLKDQLVAIRDGLFILVSLLLGFTLALGVPRGDYDVRCQRLSEIGAPGQDHV